MDDLRDVITHLNNHLHAHKQEMIALRQLAQNFFVREPEYSEDVIQLDTANQNAKFILRMSFPARYVNVINNTGANIYIATGEPALQPATSILVQANRAASFIINKTQVITVFQSGTAADGQNTVNFQFSDHPLPMTANTVSIQQINVQTTGSNTANMALEVIPTSNAAAQLPNVSSREVTLIAQKTNANTVYVGDVNVLHVDAPGTAPTLATATTGGSVAGNVTAYVKYTWKTANGETMASPESSIVIPNTTNTNTITVTLPAFPSGVTMANVYIATASGNETKQGSTNTTTYTQTAALVAGSALPTFSTADRYGAALDAKDSMTFAISNLDMLYLYGTAGDGVSYVAI